jgi:hypothetical protein
LGILPTFSGIMLASLLGKLKCSNQKFIGIFKKDLLGWSFLRFFGVDYWTAVPAPASLSTLPMDTATVGQHSKGKEIG